MTTLRQAAQAVLERWDSPLWQSGTTAAAIADLRTALEQPEQGPVTIVDAEGVIIVCSYKYKPGDKLYTTPPAAQRPWQGLTEGERNDLEDYCKMTIGKTAFDAIEAKLKECNT